MRGPVAAGGIGIFGPAARIIGNVVTDSGLDGITGTSAGIEVANNVIIANRGSGLNLEGTARIHNNTVAQNGDSGILIDGVGSAIRVDHNNVFGNVPCGVFAAVGTVVADGNFWGAATGPGAEPADQACASVLGSVIVSNPAVREISVSPQHPSL